MNDMQIFNYGEIPVRTFLMNGEPWWVLADVCRVLNLTTPAKVAERLDEDEKGMSLIHTPGGNQNMTIISESGLYKVILRSDKPEAKAFSRWVTHEVLPAIRKTGCYGVTVTEKEPFTNEQRIRVMDIISRCTKHTLPEVLKYCDPEWPMSIPEPAKDVSVSITVPPKSEFGEWLTATLLKHGMSQNQLAKAVGCGKASISRFCNGKGIPSARIYQSITEIFSEGKC